MNAVGWFFEVCLYGMMVLLAVSTIFLFLSLAKGPKLEDRVVAIDLFSSVLLSSIGLYAVFSEQKNYLDIALVLSLFAFLGTVIFARFIEQEAGSPK